MASMPSTQHSAPPPPLETATPPPIDTPPPLLRSPSSTKSISPPGLDTILARAALPISSVSDTTARFPDLSRPTTKMERTLSGSSVKSASTKGPSATASARGRSASISSLQSFVESGALDRTKLSRRRSSNVSIGTAAEALAMANGGKIVGNGQPVQEEEGEEAGPSNSEAVMMQQPSTTGDLAQLRWGTSWWPFAIVEPEGADVKGKRRESASSAPFQEGDQSTTTLDKKPSRTFLELITGRGAVEENKARQEQERRYDQAEGELLATDLDALRIASTSESSTFSQYGEADEFPPTLPSKTNSPRPPSIPSKDSSPHFLPTPMFSSSSTFAPVHLTPPKAPPLEGPSSLFSSFSISNPFSAIPLPLSGSKSASHSPTHSLSSSPSPTNRPHLGRSYSNGATGKGTKRKDVDEFLDEEDKKAAKIEDDSHMDMFTLIKERYNCPKFPIVFCHGLFGFDYLGPSSIKPLQFSYWVGVKEALEAIGVEVLIGRVPASASIEERAKVLCELIEQTFPGREVNLIGHSMGGLDCRFLITHLKPTTFKVKSLTTIATPHRGSSFADYLLEDILGQERVPTLLNFMSGIGVPGGGKAFDDLTTTKMARFNEETPDDPEVKYFSYGAEFTAGWSNPFRISWGIVLEREGENDGLVSVESSKWGEYKATLYNVNHLDLIGMVGKVRYSWAEWTGKPIKFKPISFYSTIAEMLADEGF